MCILTELTADELRTAEHVRPLVVAAELHVAAVVLEHIVEVIALHDHVVELQEAQALFHALLVALSTQHIVHGEARADLAQELNVVERLEPLGIVEHERLAVREVNEALHLTLETLGIVLDGLLSKHLAHIGAAGGVADERRAVADEGDGLVAGHLQALHQAQRHKVTNVQRIRRAVKANVKRGFAVVDHVFDLFLIGHLRDQAAFDQFIIQCHHLISSYMSFFDLVLSKDFLSALSTPCDHMGTVTLAAVFRHKLLTTQAAKLLAEALRHLLGHSRGSYLISGESERHHCSGDAAADLTAAHTAAKTGRNTPGGIFIQSRFILQRHQHALCTVAAVRVICDGRFLDVHGYFSPFSMDCL